MGGKFYYYDKSKPGDGVRHRNPEKVFCDRHIYSSIRNDGSRDAILEHFFSRMESDAASLFDEVEKIVQRGHIPDFSEEQKRFFIDYMYRQWKRSPDVHKQHTSRENFESILEEIVAEKFSGEGLTAKLQEIDNLTDAQLQRIYQNAKVQAFAAGFVNLEEIFMKREMIFATPDEESRNYIIGSNPILRDAYGETTSLNDKTAVAMPVSKKLVIGFTYDGQRGGIFRHDRGTVRNLNVGIADQSSEIAGPSHEQIESLIRRR